MYQHSKKILLTATAAFALLGATAAFAAGGTIQIMSPKDGATLSASGDNKLDYEIMLGSGDDHFHVWVNGERGGPVRDLKGSYPLPKMAPGKHAIIIKIVDKAHVPTGPEKSVFVKVE